MSEPGSYDVIVVGGGTAGCVLAARLSEQSSRRVLLLEAGPDYAGMESFPPELARAGSMAASFPGHPNNWSYVCDIADGRAYPLARGKVLGGSSAVNGTYFVRGRPSDFDHWAALGNDLWSYEHVLAFYKKSEHDLDFVNEFHGQDGPIPVRRPHRDALRPVSYAFIEACTDAGHPEEVDKNAPGTDGVGIVPRNVLDGFRMNTAATYLAPARDRPNLDVMGETYVRRVLFDGTRAVGVEAERRGERVRIEAGEIVLSAGGLQSPHLLLLSGIGPADAIRRHGIDVVHDSPGVGRNVKDHPSATVYYQVRDDEKPLPVDFTTPFQTCVNYSSSSSGSGDLQITCGAASYGQMLRGVATTRGKQARLPSYLKRPVATLRNLRRLPTGFVVSNALNSDNLALLVQLEGENSSGEISLASPDPDDAPVIRLGYLSDPDDLPRIMANVRHAMEILRSSPFERLGVRRIDPTDDDVASDASLESWVRAKLGSSLHTSCSARMGPVSDPDAVVDQWCRVHGVEGLRVVDISIMPTITRRGPAATAVMIGERVADLWSEPGERDRDRGRSDEPAGTVGPDEGSRA